MPLYGPLGGETNDVSKCVPYTLMVITNHPKTHMLYTHEYVPSFINPKVNNPEMRFLPFCVTVSLESNFFPVWIAPYPPSEGIVVILLPEV
jgi:hypothetical protein